MKIGQLTILKLSHKKEPYYYFWKCLCSCGNLTFISTSNLTKKNPIQSCGCLQKSKTSQANKKHGKSRTKEYTCWLNMRRRCNQITNKSYRHYGGRGIKVCNQWQHSFEIFLKDMKLAPSLKHSIERKNNDGNYSPDNCKWATRTEQMNNFRKNHKLTYQNKTMNICQWSDILEIKWTTLYARIFKYKWSVDRAFNTPMRIKPYHSQS